MSNSLYILQLAGIGDTLSIITRLKSIKEAHPNHDIIFLLGGYGFAPEASKMILEEEGYKAQVIKNLHYHNQLPGIREALKSSLLKDGDLLLDVSFCEEIFNNKEPEFWKYGMEFPYKYKATPENTFPKKLIAIHPLTKSGNAEGFDSDVERGRFWERDNWKQLCINLCDRGYTPIFCGYDDEDWGLYSELKDEGYKCSFIGKQPIHWVIDMLKNVEGSVTCNSWTWELTARAGIPTVCFYTKNHFFIQNHIPSGPSTIWNNLYIETSNRATHQDILDKLMYMIDNKRKPEIPYSVCMITYNDSDVINKTLQNVRPYIVNDFVIIDGGSTDKTINRIEMLRKLEMGHLRDNINLIEKNWADNFEVQKNFALDQASNDWRVWIDADEMYDHLFWNQLGWYIFDAEKQGIDCIRVPRINTITGMSKEELGEYATRNGWVINGPFGNWVNYPDTQQRVFKRNCRFVGRTHETIVGFEKEGTLEGVHCIHPKTKERQERGFAREKKQYEIEAKKVKARILEDE